ncbi:MAG: cation:proton antiporter domain-containing protein, partial [Planctomycetota bacterium]
METLAASGQLQHAIVGDLLVILAVTGFTALVMQRMRLALVPAYLVAGALIGPHALGFVASQESLADVSQFAIILLLFGIGLELDVSVLRQGVVRMLVAGLASCVACVAVGWPAAMALGLAPPAALAVSMAFSLSSTAVVLRIIADRRELRRRSGRLAFAVLVMQDITVLAMFACLPLIAQWAGTGGPALLEAHQERGFVITAITRLCGVTLLVFAAKVLLPGVLRESLKARRLEVMLLVGIAAALGAAVAAQAIGFSLEMGAFLAGFVLAGTPFRHQLSGQIGPL